MKYSEVKVFARELRKNQTLAESYFWSKVRNRKFYGHKFNRQFIIEHESRQYFIVDFYCFTSKLIIEIDGKIHRFQFEYDKLREGILEKMGFSILRFSNKNVLENWSFVETELIKKLSPNPSLIREGK